MTSRLVPEHTTEVGALWRCLGTRFSVKLPIILHHLFIFATLSLDQMLPVKFKIVEWIFNLLNFKGGPSCLRLLASVSVRWPVGQVSGRVADQ
jgi:hypothetical protein